MCEELRKAMELLNVKTAFDLSNEYTKHDQVLMKSGQWDHENNALLVNKIKNLLIQIPKGIRVEEDVWITEVLWFWHHHAISSALSKKQFNRAKEFATKALDYQRISGYHPNKITRLLYLLVHDRRQDAEIWASRIKAEPEKSTAQDLLRWYKEGYFKP